MPTALKQFLCKDNVLYASLGLALLASAIEISLCFGFEFQSRDLGFVLLYLMNAVFLLLLVASYRKHEKNVMKCTVGIVLALMCVLYLMLITYCGFTTRFLIQFAAALCVLIAHLVINQDHTSSPRAVFVNQLFAVFFLILCVVSIFFTAGTENASVAVFCELTAFFSIAVVICIETKLDSFRTNREAAGWTEKTGYPEEYVHEFEKK